MTIADVHHRLTGGPPTRGRRVLVWSLVGLALVLVLVASLTVWVQRQALDTDNWVDTSSELLGDESIRTAVGLYLVDQLWEHGVVPLSHDLRKRYKTGIAMDVLRLAGTVVGGVRAIPLGVRDGRFES